MNFKVWLKYLINNQVYIIFITDSKGIIILPTIFYKLWTDSEKTIEFYNLNVLFYFLRVVKGITHLNLDILKIKCRLYIKIFILKSVYKYFVINADCNVAQICILHILYCIVPINFDDSIKINHRTVNYYFIVDRQKEKKPWPNYATVPKHIIVISKNIFKM